MVSSVLQFSCIISAGPLCRRGEQFFADLKVDRNVLTRRYALQEIVVPGLEWIDPAGDRVNIWPENSTPELRPPAIVPERVHRHLGPCFVVLMTISNHRRD